MQKTSNLNLNLVEGTDKIDLVNQLNPNFETIDVAVAAKQGATDNTLNTDAKTVSGAINELDGEITELKEDLGDKLNKSIYLGENTVRGEKTFVLEDNYALYIIFGKNVFANTFIAYVHTRNSGVCSCKIITQHSDAYSIESLTNNSFVLTSGSVDTSVYAIKII